tara:strand:- start:478 stop:696 length:219 start_codon:yes stop_codon:yes gene_type:complete
MSKKYTNVIQTLLDQDTLDKLNKLIMIEAIENDKPMKGKSEWIRDLIEDTVNYQFNKKKLDEWVPGMIKKLK